MSCNNKSSWSENKNMSHPTSSVTQCRVLTVAMYNGDVLTYALSKGKQKHIGTQCITLFNVVFYFVKARKHSIYSVKVMNPLLRR